LQQRRRAGVVGADVTRRGDQGDGASRAFNVLLQPAAGIFA
jgi:hypothetical protein